MTFGNLNARHPYDGRVNSALARVSTVCTPYVSHSLPWRLCFCFAIMGCGFAPTWTNVIPSYISHVASCFPESKVTGDRRQSSDIEGGSIFCSALKFINACICSNFQLVLLNPQFGATWRLIAMWMIPSGKLLGVP